jgi:hypothetical protein
MAVSVETIEKLSDSKALRDTFNIDLRWRILTMKGGKARIVPYQDARDVQTVLDAIVGQTNWTNEPRNIDGKLYMAIGINVEGEGWVYKADVGTETDVEAVKGESSDAFKRAAVMWGIFRDVYQMGYVVLDTDGKYPLTPEKVQLQTPEAIALYCNSINAPMGHLKKLYSSIKSGISGNAEVTEAIKILTNYVRTL